jgi:hypothetical protein
MLTNEFWARVVECGIGQESARVSSIADRTSPSQRNKGTNALGIGDGDKARCRVIIPEPRVIGKPLTTYEKGAKALLNEF